MKSNLKQIIQFLLGHILFPLGESGIANYSRVVKLTENLLPKKLFEKLINLPKAKEGQVFVVSSLVTPYKYRYMSSERDDLRYSCRRDFRDWEVISRIFFKTIVSNSSIVVDVGAYTGVYSIEAALSNRNCKIYSFEPNSKVIELLKENVRINALNQQITVAQTALGSGISVSKFYNDSTKASSTASLLSDEGGFEEVAVSTLDHEFSNIKIDAIKLDIEGFEDQVYLGGTECIRNSKPIILSEALTLLDLKKQQSVLEGFGYLPPLQVSSVTRSDKRNYIWTVREDQERVLDILQSSRRLFQKRDS